MAFNRSKFNHVPFNVQSDMVKWLHVRALEEVDAVIGSALDFFPLAIGNERVGAVIDGDCGTFITASGTETITEEVIEAQMTVILFPHFEEEVTEEISLSAEIMPTVTGNETVDCDAALGADFYPVVIGNETPNAYTRIAAKIYPVAEGYELISESASLENLETRTCVLTLTLKPGQTLIVDANNYNVLLDNANAIDKQSGDWIDELNRNTTDIKITASSGVANLSASILYTERYL